MEQPKSEVHETHITIVQSTDFSMEQLYNLIDFANAEAKRSGKERILIDTRRMRGSMTESQRFMGGTRMAQVFGPRLRVAILMPRTQITKLGELAAINRGARVFVTDDENRGLEWLLI
jgi:hypothetical protein